jgi:hypothetical protein
MTARPIPRRYWRSYGTDPLPTGEEALDEPFRAFPSWFMRVTCDRCGQRRMFSETHSAQGDMLIRDIIARMRHDGCGGHYRNQTTSRQTGHAAGSGAGTGVAIPNPDERQGGWPPTHLFKPLGSSILADV